MQIYDNQVREKVLNYLAKGHTIAETHEVFEIGTTTIKAWKKRYRETGSYEKKKPNRTHKKLDPVKLRAYVDEHPDSYLREIAEAFNCSITGVFNALKRLKITRKKND